MLRPTLPTDAPALLEMARETGVFYPHEIDTLAEVLDDYFAEGEESGQVMRTWEEGGAPVAFVHFSPAPMTLGTWELWWVVVAKSRQGTGLGRWLVAFAEQEVRQRGGRVLFIETGGTPVYESTRQFYRKCGYDEVARLPEYYRAGDDKVVFAKFLQPAPV